MTTRFGELNEFFDPGLEFTIAGKPYRIDPPSAEVGVWCHRVAIVAGGVNRAKTDAEIAAAVERVQALPDELPEGKDTVEQVVLGDTYDRLVADGVDHARIRFLFQVAMTWVVHGEDMAAELWNTGGRPEAQAPNRADRRASRSTGVAGSTRRRGSTSGTTSRPTKSLAKAGRSAGKTS